MPLASKRTISSPKSFKSKKTNLRHWLMVLPFILLLVGLAAAAVLLSSNQDLRQQAAGFAYEEPCGNGAMRCGGSNAVQKCESNTWKSVQPCSAGTLCTEVSVATGPMWGKTEYKCSPSSLSPTPVPQLQVCGNGEIKCSGNAVQKCESNKWKTVQSCSASQICQKIYSGNMFGGSVDYTCTSLAQLHGCNGSCKKDSDCKPELTCSWGKCRSKTNKSSKTCSG